MQKHVFYDAYKVWKLFGKERSVYKFQHFNEILSFLPRVDIVSHLRECERF